MQRFESSAFQAHISCPRTDVQLVRHGAVLTVSLSYQGAYGMGEKYDALNQKGRVVVNQVEEKFCFQGEKHIARRRSSGQTADSACMLTPAKQQHFILTKTL